MIKNLLPAIALAPLCCQLAWADDAALQSQAQKFAYAVGQQVGQNITRQDIKIDQQAFDLGFKDALSKHDPRISKDEMKAAFEWQAAESNKQREAKAKENLETGKKFLEENKKKEGVKELAGSGVQYKVLEAGKGNKPKVTDTISVHYVGKLINGTEFDSSRKRGEPATFQLSSVIKGWQEILPLMEEGAKWEAYIPPSFAYGERGSPGGIGPNETLIFEIELLSIKPATNKEPAAGEPAAAAGKPAAKDSKESKPASEDKPAEKKN
jgi:FKBP-type peptidyl-prolyl cis-trans isomerase FklB